MTGRRKMVAVIGNGGEIAPTIADAARSIGRLALDAGFRLVTGGLGGVMAAASEGARASAAYVEGSVVGVLPSYDRSTANAWVDIVVPTGMQLGRNILVVSMADVVIAVGGGSGTLGEMALAWQLGRPLVALVGPEGWSSELAGRRIDGRQLDVVHAASTPEEAVSLAQQLASSQRPEAGDVGSGWRKGPG